MKTWICLALALLMTGACLVGCSEHLPDDLAGDLSYTSRINGSDHTRTICWDQYVLTESSDAIYDRNTGELQLGFCEDPECDGDCFLHQGSLTLIAVRDGRAYFVMVGKKTVYLAYRDMLTGEAHVLLNYSWEERVLNQPSFLDGEYLYYTRKILKDGGDPNAAEDYYAHLCRISKDGGEEEVLYAMRDNTETLLVVADGDMYTYYNSAIWRADVSSLVPRELCNMAKTGLGGLGDVCYLDGALYFYTNGEQSGMYVCTMDVESGEWRYLMDTPVHSYELTNDGIYFMLTEMWQINDPALYPPDSEEACFHSHYPTLYACDLDGGNVREIWSSENTAIDFSHNFTVVDQVLYGQLQEFDFENNAWGEHRFVEIHLDTGVIIPATVVK